MEIKEKFSGIYLIDNNLATINSAPGFKPFGEHTEVIDKKEYRFWDPYRSKAAAAIIKGVKEFPIKIGIKILYLGAAHGYTCSFLSNIIGNKGIIYAIEFSERCFHELLPICEKYKNIVPILADARKPELYSWVEKVDVVYCDIAQPDQTEIAIRNCNEFLKEKGWLMLAVKTQSIDVTKSTKEITRQEIEKLKNAGFEIIDWKILDPFEEKHSFIIARKV
ncbi:MAG: fibrillarin-like rRNA/tRNA 2'-O-methyltransferase [Candidatus Aenigmatarchaeota archaeon]|nr:fibrillarin-like rRNA/tRNA 2'-O-methyltransferase [Candidatus Aenigmarchaeota archaeon]